MSTYDDDDIEFDFFDEPETVEATQRRRLPRLERPGGRGGGERPPRPPMRTPTGLVPARAARRPDRDRDRDRRRARLLGRLVPGEEQAGRVRSYVEKVRTIANADTALGKKFANELVAPGLKQSDLETKLEQYAQHEQQAFQQAQQIRPPGPLRAIHQHLVDAIQLRAQGLNDLGDTLAQTATSKNQTDIAAKLTAAGTLLTLERCRVGAALRRTRDAAVEEPGRDGRHHPELAVRRQHRLRQRPLVHPAPDAPRRRIDGRHAERQARRRARVGSGDAAGHDLVHQHCDDGQGLRRSRVRRHGRGLRRLQASSTSPSTSRSTRAARRSSSTRRSR